MKRNNIIDIPSQNSLLHYKSCIAFHEAGHAAAIYLNNKAKGLPVVFFQIVFKDIKSDVIMNQASHDDSIARVDGGRLIESIPYSIHNFTRNLIDRNEAMMPLLSDYIIAFEADIINLLIGPLAEAKYVYSKDGELFNHQLIGLSSLKNYGGHSDLTLVREYLESFSTDKQEQDEKLVELFAEACCFLNDISNWKAITKLADYMLNSNKIIISCEEVVTLIDS